MQDKGNGRRDGGQLAAVSGGSCVACHSGRERADFPPHVPAPKVRFELNCWRWCSALLA
jgi:mono/diheme cytochrome c family protein